MAKIDELEVAVQNGKAKVAAQLAQEALDEGSKAPDILDAMVRAMGVVGEKFSAGEIFVPEMLVAAKAMKKGMAVIDPYLKGADAQSLGKCIIGTVKGDLHDIGKNLVSTMIGAAGFDMIDLGVDVPVEKFVETIEANPDVKVVALSALLTTTMQSMADTAEALKPLREKYGFKMIVGGAPITQAFADEIGADGYSVDAGAAAVLAKEVVA